MSELRRSALAPPVRHVHLGLGNFFRAHQAWYGAHSASGWGIAAFTGRASDRSRAVVDALSSQDGLYTLVTRGSDGDRFEVVGSIVRAHTADHGRAWLGYLSDPQVQVVTTTVTEAGYLRGADGGLDIARPEVAADIAALRREPSAAVSTAPALLVAGLAARRAAGAGPLTVVPCDNLPANGAAVARVVGDLASRVDPGLAAWIASHVAYATTMVDRITPEATDADRADVEAATGVRDRATVVTEPFTEWVISGDFAAGRPDWQDAGATFTTDVAPFEERKLWLLNGGHSLLAYAGSLRGHVTVADAMRDDTCRAWLREWWDVALRHLSLPTDQNAAYVSALTERFANSRMRHRLDQIAWDGSQKLPIRVLPVLRRERADGRLPAASTRTLAAWVCHLRGAGATVTDVRSAELVALAAGPLADAVRRIVAVLDPELATDGPLVGAVTTQAAALAQG